MVELLMSKKSEQDYAFQHTVLKLLWLIFLYTAGKRPLNQIYSARDSCIAFGDVYGVQGEAAKKYRRENTYWWND
jgi:hypothetical protein